MIDKYKDDIIVLIKKNGPMGVNALQRELDVPLTTLQKYLHRQTYFKINEDRKWDLPENVIADIKNNTLELMTNVVENSILLLKSQMDEMQLSLNNALVPISTLKRGISNLSAGVASTESGQKITNPHLLELIKHEGTLKEIFSKKKDNILEEYRNLLFNFDYIGLVRKEGEEYTKEFLEQNTYELLAGRTQILTEDTIQILKENQKGT